MIFLSVETDRVKILALRRSLMGQYEAAYAQKVLQLPILKKGKVESVDVLASSIKECVVALPSQFIKEKEVCLILPQEAVYFFRSEVPADMTLINVLAFVKDKASAVISRNLDQYAFDYYLDGAVPVRNVFFYATEIDTLTYYNEAISLLNLEMTVVIPESITYFSLFDKTLRKDKHELIMFSSYDGENLMTNFYDTYGPLPQPKSRQKVADSTPVIRILRQKIAKSEEAGMKINRLIISGDKSEQIRQDTFTRDVGVWTNPLKRIVPTFYQDYIKMLIITSKEPFPYLSYDSCFGAFIFVSQNCGFSLYKSKFKTLRNIARPKKSLKLPFSFGQFAVFVLTFFLSILTFYLLSRINYSQIVSGFLSKSTSQQPLSTKVPEPTQTMPTPTKAPSPTEAPPDRANLNIEVLNGTGTVGQASDMKTLLETKGYEKIVTGNTDFNHVKTEIKIKKNMQALQKLIIEDLKPRVINPKITFMEADSTVDIVVITGKDFK